MRKPFKVCSTILKLLYADHNFDSEEIGDLFGVSDRTICKYLKVFVIPVRKKCIHKYYSQKRENNYNWRGGRRITGGHVRILIPEHPYANKEGMVYEHRVIMEKQLGRILNSNEIVHHKNGNGLDNRLENLQLVTISEHRAIHNIGNNYGHFRVNKSGL